MTTHLTAHEFAATSLRELIRHIVGEHHAYLRKALPRIAGQLTAGQASAELAGAFENLRYELMNHLDKEEAVLFPAIDRFESSLQAGEPLPKPCFGSIELPIHIMEEEHELAKVQLARIRELTGDYSLPGEYCRSLRELDQDLQIHMALESDVLFPRALMLESA
jgi:regulator of cell morphogenesis and NO signaling